MTRIVIKQLIWDDWNIKHIQKHDVTVKDIEAVAKNFTVHAKAKKGRYLIIGRNNSRIITIIINRKGTGTYYPVTARDAAQKERQKVYEKENR